ncbi:MAG: hypothetical protein ACI4V5_04860 [Prevotella sp.]
MRKIAYLYFLLLTLGFTACTNDDDRITEDVSDIADNGSSLYATLPSTGPVQQGKLRSTISFDDNTKTMVFSWEEGDKIAVFPYKEDNSSTQVLYKIDEIKDAHNATFVQDDADVNYGDITKGTTYVSYLPVVQNHEGGSNAIPVTFRNQAQENMVNMKDYYAESSAREDYKASEMKATEHLPKYDFLTSTAESPEDGSLHFQYTRLSSIVRLFLKVTDEITYDEIFIINKEADFILDAQMDISKTDSKEAFTNPTTAHTISLKLGKATKNIVDEQEIITYDGFKVWNDDATDDKCTLWSNRYNKGYIVLYMMFAPIELKNLSVNSTLYLIGHDNNKNKQYYKATLSKINIAQNKIQQWAPAQMDDPDGAIEVTKAEVEEWLEDTNFDNGGTGTDDW